MFSTEFKGEKDVDHHVLTVRRPSIPAAEERIEEIEIPGRNGGLTSSSGLYDNVVIPVEFNFMTAPSNWNEVYRNVKKWLSGSGELKFSDDAGMFYKALFCRITDSERTSRRLGNLTAEFTCDPFCYYEYGKREIAMESPLYNPGWTCEPVYRITGEGNCTLTVNGYEFTANVGQEIIIDTNRQISYKNDGQMLNTDVTGDYADLWLKPGDNTISVTSGFSVNITPMWREL
jgi:phage-related protein